MVRNFVTGVVLGGVVAAGGLVVVSQIAPMKRPDGIAPTELAATETPATAAPEAGAPKTVPGAVEPQAEATIDTDAPGDAQPDVADPAPLADTPAETDEPFLRPLTDPDVPPPASVAPDLAQPSGSGDIPTVGSAPEPAQVAAAAPKAAAEPMAEAPEAGSTAGLAQEQAEEQAEGAAVPAVEPAPASEGAAATEDPAPAAATEPSAAEPAADTAKLTEEATVDKAETTTLSPDPQIDEKTVEGVTIGRLPSITAETPTPPPVTATAPAADATEPPVAEAEATADLPPLRRYARAFDNPGAKPLFAVLLVDTGAPDVARADLAALPFPITFVLDPMSDGAAEAEAIYRAAGQEVVMLATGIPKGATASDLEQSFAGLEGKLTQTVALIDTTEGAFQNDRKLSAEVVTLLVDQGRGLVTFDRGLNAADQVARREGLPTATIFRSLDDDGEDSPLIRRYLDRAAFKAAQEGMVAVIGSTRPETIAALMEWAVEGRASSVALAPITALMESK